MPPSTTTMPTKASTRWAGLRSMTLRYFFRRTGRSQKGPGGLLSARPLPLLSGGSAPGWLAPLLLLPGPAGGRRGGLTRAASPDGRAVAGTATRAAVPGPQRWRCIPGRPSGWARAA